MPGQQSAPRTAQTAGGLANTYRGGADVAEPTEATILPFCRPGGGVGPTEDQQRLVNLAVEGEYVERLVRTFAVRAGLALDHLVRTDEDRRWSVPLCGVLAKMAAAVEDAVHVERRP